MHEHARTSYVHQNTFSFIVVALLGTVTSRFSKFSVYTDTSRFPLFRGRIRNINYCSRVLKILSNACAQLNYYSCKLIYKVCNVIQFFLTNLACAKLFYTLFASVQNVRNRWGFISGFNPCMADYVAKTLPVHSCCFPYAGLMNHRCVFEEWLSFTEIPKKKTRMHNFVQQNINR